MAIRRATLMLILVMCLVVGGLGLGGCKKPRNEDAVKLGQAGSTVSRQMAEYYESVQRDVMDTWRLEPFGELYDEQNNYDRSAKRTAAEAKEAEAKAEKAEAEKAAAARPSRELSKATQGYVKEYTETYKALAARARLARAMQQTYDSYARLAGYDFSADVEGRTDELIGSVAAVAAVGAAGLPVPTGVDAAKVAAGVVTGCLADLRKHLAQIHADRALLNESAEILKLLTKVKELFDAERVLCCYIDETSGGGPAEVKGIVGHKFAAYEQVACALIEQDLIVSDGLLDRVAEDFGLGLPDPPQPLTQSAIKAGLEHSIRAEAFARAQLYHDAGDGIARSLEKIIGLHEKLAQGKRVTLEEVAQDSAAVQAVLDVLTGSIESEDADA